MASSGVAPLPLAPPEDPSQACAHQTPSSSCSTVIGTCTVAMYLNVPTLSVVPTGVGTTLPFTGSPARRVAAPRGKIVCETLGHPSTRIAKDLYQHVSVQMQIGASETVVALLPARNAGETGS